MEPVEVAVAVVEAPVEVAPQPQPPRDERPRDERGRGGDRRSEARGDRREPRRDDKPVVGMGDHMPDFLLRSFAPPVSD
jgi:hypothetical protein